MNYKQLAELAKEVDKSDPKDWGDLSIDEKSSYELVALSVLESMYDMEKEVLLATITSLVVDNMILNMKLLKK